MSENTPDIPYFQIGDIVFIAESRFAPFGPYSRIIGDLWRKYGNRYGKVIGYSDKASNGVDKTDACVIQFDDGDTVTWEIHHLRKMENL